MKIQHLQGLISAPFTPFDSNGKLDVSLIPAYYAFLKRNGITGAFINGSTGEGVSTTSEPLPTELKPAKKKSQELAPSTDEIKKE